MYVENNVCDHGVIQYKVYSQLLIHDITPRHVDGTDLHQSINTVHVCMPNN